MELTTLREKCYQRRRKDRLSFHFAPTGLSAVCKLVEPSDVLPCTEYQEPDVLSKLVTLLEVVKIMDFEDSLATRVLSI